MAELDYTDLARRALLTIASAGTLPPLDSPRVAPLLPAFGEACWRLHSAMQEWRGGVSSAVKLSTAAVDYARALQAIEEAVQLALTELAGGTAQ